MPRRVLILARTRNLAEMRELVASLGDSVVAEALQERDAPDPRTFLGRGRVDALVADLAAHHVEAEIVVVAGDLKPSQVIELETALKRPVYDRVRLILEIFRDRASSEAAKLQVELAQLHYELPVLREAIHRMKSGERPGFLGGGVTAFATQLEPVRSRMAHIRRRLDQIRRERGLRRKNRRREGYWQVSLAGYTNAGKSTLLNALTRAEVLAEDRLFSTLETRTRRVLWPKDAPARGTRAQRSRLLITDTVGFIEDLPPWLVEAFHATLEEIAFADLVLLVVDASDSLAQLDRKLRTSLEVLRSFLAGEGRPELVDHLYLVFNKRDLAPPERDFEQLATTYGFGQRFAVVSAATGVGLDDFLVRMRAAIPDRRVFDLALPSTGEGLTFLHRIQGIAEIETVDADGKLAARIAVPLGRVEQMRSMVSEIGGQVRPVD